MEQHLITSPFASPITENIAQKLIASSPRRSSRRVRRKGPFLDNKLGTATEIRWSFMIFSDVW